MQTIACSNSTSSDPHVYLWTAGGGVLGIVDIERMEYDLVEGLAGSPGESLPHAILAVGNGRKIVSVNTKKSTGGYYLNYWTKSANNRVTTRLVESVDSDGSYYLTKCIESIR